MMKMIQQTFAKGKDHPTYQQKTTNVRLEFAHVGLSANKWTLQDECNVPASIGFAKAEIRVVLVLCKFYFLIWL